MGKNIINKYKKTPKSSLRQFRRLKFKFEITRELVTELLISYKILRP